jgi:hypothetical protein
MIRYIILILIGFAYPSMAQDTFSRELDLPPLRLTYADLLTTIQTALDYVKPVNANPPPRNPTGELSISAVGVETTLADLSHGVTGRKLPEVAYAANYRFYAPEQRISSVSIWLRDSGRSIKVEGRDPNHVDALAVLLERQLSSHSYYFGGLGFRLFGWLGAILLLNVLAQTSIFPVWLRISAIIVLVLFMVTAIFLPYERAFPGFAIYAGEASFIRRYSAELSFALGTIPLIAVAGTAIFNYIRAHHNRTAA